MPELFTRSQYMDNTRLAGLTEARRRAQQKDDHRRYYSQFVTPETIAAVLSVFSIDRLRSAAHKDRHLNSIPLQEWDNLCVTNTDLRQGQRRSLIRLLPCDADLIKKVGDSSTLSMLVCIAKEAARQAIEAHKDLAAE